MFKRPHHVRIANILQSLNAKELESRGCLFGGGTAITLIRDEFRESIDIDFLVSDINGYKDLRYMIKSTNDLSPITHKDFPLYLSREIRSDQYGIRTFIRQGEIDIKFEVVFEARIPLQAPGLKNSICGISTLTEIDMAASKLLANSDRWADDSVFNRDLIDLAMLQLPLKKLRQAKEKAALAYGLSVERDLQKSIERLKSRPGRLTSCMSALKIDSTPEALLWDKIRRLS